MFSIRPQAAFLQRLTFVVGSSLASDSCSKLAPFGSVRPPVRFLRVRLARHRPNQTGLKTAAVAGRKASVPPAGLPTESKCVAESGSFSILAEFRERGRLRERHLICQTGTLESAFSALEKTQNLARIPVENREQFDGAHCGLCRTALPYGRAV